MKWSATACLWFSTFLGEGVSQSGETAHPHPHREVGALDVASRDVLGVRVAHYLSNLCADNYGGAIAPLAFGRGSVNLVQHRVIDAVPAEHILNGDQVRAKPIGRKLDATDKATLKIAQEDSRGCSAPIPDVEARDEFGIGIERCPRPYVAHSLRTFRGVCAASLHSDKAPDLVALDAGAGEIHQRFLLVGETGRSHVLKQMDNGVLCYSRHTAGSPNRNTVNKGGKDTHSLLYAQSIHGYKYA